ncbi:hypothetical protein QAD02_019035 [Eretmocerus hayati]|uniref:Uncharacterized protein n=1 Tax=Eretmocerus hayati TaxID=131215 RepID=A0ACC2PIF5_9HYME|nr:hypothetical protein QAD02_019035 [Eretmocerus hayati]
MPQQVKCVGEDEENNDSPENRIKNSSITRLPSSPGATLGPALLEEIFYISSKRSTLYRVRLTEKCLSLRKESSTGASKTESILVDDIVGCRCMRSKRRNASSCGPCGPGASRTQPRLVESTEQLQPHDEYDSSAYLYIYAYTLKRAKVVGKSPGRRERMTVTLRFRSFDRYEDNLREASRWRLALQCLLHKLPVPKPYMSPAHRNLHSLLAATPNDPRKLLVILNPKSGSGRGRENFQRRVHPILAEAEMPYDIFITRHSDYARDFVRSRDLSQWSGIVLVGGDGIVYEAINGLLQRPDWQDCLERLPIGVIPCGSGNGLAKSIAYAKQEPYDYNPMLISALSIVKRNVSQMDLVRVETRKQTLYSFLSVGWGLLADIDIESERLRAIGGQRFTIWSVARLIGLRTYKGTIYYLPSDDADVNSKNHKNGNDSIHTEFNHNNISHSKSFADELDRYSSGGNQMRESKSYDGVFEENEYNDSKQRPLTTNGNMKTTTVKTEYGNEVDDFEIEDEPIIMNDVLTLETESSPNGVINNGGIDSVDGCGFGIGRRRCDSFFSAKSRKSTYFSTGSGSISSTYHSVNENGDPNCNMNGKDTIVYGPPPTLPALTTKVPSSWVKVEGEFVMVYAAYQSHMSQDCHFAPRAKLNDGIIWLLIIKAGISRTGLLQFLLGLSTGAHLSCPGVEMIPVRAFRIEPVEDSEGLLTVDGEKVDYGPIQGEIFSSLASVMCP